MEFGEDIFFDENFAGGKIVLFSALGGWLFKAEHEDLKVDLVIFDRDGVRNDKRGEALRLALQKVAKEPLLLLVLML